MITLKKIRRFYNFYKHCKHAEISMTILLLRYIYILLFYKKRFFLHQNVVIKGLKNIQASQLVSIGIGYTGIMHKRDRTYLNIEGTLIIKGKYSIGRGCRIAIGKDAVVTIGSGGFINFNTNLIISNALHIGDNCSISWNCQFLDDDYHTINYPGKKESENSINIGNKVWIGSGAQIYKGTIIPDGCVIASNSVVRGVFTTENTLIGGNPAKVIKENINWS